MSGNSFGKILTLTTWGESHGDEIGAVLDGVPANIEIKEDFIQEFLNRRNLEAQNLLHREKKKIKLK